MKHIFLILLLTLSLAAGTLPAQQSTPGNKNSSGQPAAKRPPQAKTPEEFADYKAGWALKGGAVVEKAADDFAAKYPKSELKALLYAKALSEYETENDPPKMLATGDKVLLLDPDNTIALVVTATVMSDKLTDADPDPVKVTLIKQRSARALETVDTAVSNTSGVTAAELTARKDRVRAMAHSALGITALKSGDYAAAEKEFTIAADFGKTQPDAFVWYHLALAQDREGTAIVNTEEQQKKYAEALASVNQALRYTASNPDLDKLARGELQRLQQLTGQ